MINTALAAGHQRLRDGRAIGKKHGYRLGGSLHVMHDEAFWINFYQFRLFDSVIQDVLEICPQAWYLKVDNPVLAGITYLGRKYPEAKIVGLCHGFSAVYHIADVLGLSREHLTYQIGVNHFVWLTDLYHKGENVLPLLDRWIETEAPEYWKTCEPSDFMGPKAVDLYKRFGAFPIGDTATTGGGGAALVVSRQRRNAAALARRPRRLVRQILHRAGSRGGAHEARLGRPERQNDRRVPAEDVR